MQDIDSRIHGLASSIFGESPRLTEDEVRRAVMSAPNGKCPGPDGVPVELLKGLVSTPAGLSGLTEFYQQIFVGFCPPEEWATAFIVLLGKVEQPTQPGDLRPITVHSQVAKCFSRIVLARVRGDLLPISAGQMAMPGRRPSDYLWSFYRLTQLAYEWNEPFAAIKIDVRRAFDAVDRWQLACTLQNKLAHRPQELKSLLLMLLTSSAVLCTAWGDRTIQANSGVKQGAVESPPLFVAAMDVILASVSDRGPPETWLDIGHADLSFMDDAIAWARTIPLLQERCHNLVSVLREWGLSINAAKCQLLCWGDVKGHTLTIDGCLIPKLEVNKAMTVMGLPLRPGISPNEILTSLLDRTRRAFWANKDLLTSSAKLPQKLALLRKTVWGCIAWTIGILLPTKQMLETLNSHMYNFLVIMCRIRRRPLESFVDYQMRSRRIARQALWNSGFERWSTMHLRLAWNYCGHRARSAALPNPPLSGILTRFRDPTWWDHQQQRHGRRHFPRITNEEKSLALVHPEWRELAHNKPQWKNAETDFIQKFDVPWASGRQPALPYMP